jgi:uncharacterized delta-60 repeat protein
MLLHGHPLHSRPLDSPEPPHNDAPYIAGPDQPIVSGHSYTLNLYSNNTSFSRWLVNWGDGIVSTVSFSSSAETATHIFSDSAGSYTVTAEAENSSGDVIATCGLGLDPNFGTNAVATINVGSGYADFGAYEVYPDPSNGDILVLNAAGLSCYNSAGVLQTSFGHEGTATLTFNSSSASSGEFVYYSSAVAVDANGDIVVAGDGTDGQLVVNIFNSSGTRTATGSFSPSFTTGESTYSLASEAMFDYTPNGMLVVVSGGGGGGGELAAFTMHGDLEWDYQGGPNINFAAIEPGDGAIDAACLSNYTTERFSLYSSGRAGYYAGGPDDSGSWQTIAIQQDDKILLNMTRYSTPGVLDDSFGDDGVASGPMVHFDQVAVQSNGQLVALGIGGGDVGDLMLARYSSNGQMDSTIGNGDGFDTGLNISSSYYDNRPHVNFALAGDGYEVVAFNQYTSTVYAEEIYNTNSVRVLGPPTAQLPTSIPSGTEGVPITISAGVASGGYSSDLLSDHWTVMDGTNSYSLANNGTSGPNLTFTPNISGTLTVSLTVTDETLSESSSVGPVSFYIAPAALGIDGPVYDSEGSAATFTATGDDASSSSWIAERGVTTYATGTGSVFSFTPESDGTYTIQASNTSGTATSVLVVAYVPPTVTISGPASGYAGEAMVFSVAVDQAPGVDDPLTYQWQVEDSSGTVISIAPTSPLTDSSSTFVVPGTSALAASNTYSVQVSIGDAHNGTTTTLAQTFSFSLGEPSTNGFTWTTIPAPVLPYAGVSIVTSAETVQSDGKIVIAGYYFSGSDPVGDEDPNPFFLARFNPDMTIDPTFGVDNTGVYNIPWTWGFAEISAMTISPLNGDIVAVGQARPGSNYIPFVAEFLSEAIVYDGAMYLPGMLDPRFNAGAPAEIDPVSPYITGEATAVVALSDGSVIVGGIESSAADDNSYSQDSVFLLKVSSTGTLDTTFGTAGFAPSPIPGGYVVWNSAITDVTDITSLLLQNVSGGTALLVGGYMSLDPTYWPSDYSASAGGSSLFSDTYPAYYDQTDFFVARYNLGGTLDSSFGTPSTPGVVYASFGSGGLGEIAGSPPSYVTSPTTGVDNVAFLGNMELLGDGDILAVGAAGYDVLAYCTPAYGVENDLFWHYTNSESYLFGSVALAQFNSNGTLDTSFGNSGTLVTSIASPASTGTFVSTAGYPPSAFLASIGAYAFQSNGNIIAASVGGTAWTITSIGTLGVLDSTFGNDGTASFSGPVDLTGNSAASGINPWGPVIVSSNGIITGGAAGQNLASGESYYSNYAPLLLRYNFPSSPISDLTAAPASTGGIGLTWEGSATGLGGYEIERSTSYGGETLTSPVMIATVVPSDSSYIDSSASPNVAYYYQLVPLNTLGQLMTTTSSFSNINGATTLPSLSGYSWQQTMTLTGTGATASMTLTSGSSYLVVVSGTFALGTLSTMVGTETLTQSMSADAEDWYSDTNSVLCGNTLGTAPFGLSLNGVNVSGPSNLANHEYLYRITGEGAAMSVQFDDAYGPPASGSLELQIYESGAPTGSSPTNSPVMFITSPGTDSQTGIAVISADTPVDVIAANPNGNPVPWTLSLLSSITGGTVLLAPPSSTSIGQLPMTGTAVATIQPALFPNGVYTLELTNSSGTVVDSRQVDIETILKTGNLTFPATDITLTAPDGTSLPVTRVYDSSQADVNSGIGNGWSLNLLDSQFTETTEPDPLNPGQNVLRPGDLVSLTVPDGGTSVFEFVPQPAIPSEVGVVNPALMAYVPAFVNVSGSGATLSVDGIYWQDLLYDPSNNEYYGYIVNSGNFSSDLGVLNVPSGYNPANTTWFEDQFELTAKDGTMYVIDPTNGQIQSATDAAGNLIYAISDGNLVTSGNKPLLNIQWSDGTIQSIQAPGQNPITYNYTDGNLVSVEDRSGNVTTYSYENPFQGQVHASNYLTAVTNPEDQTILQAQYDPTYGQLLSVTDAGGVNIPVTSTGFSGSEMTKTIVDAAGNVSYDSYDGYGNLIREIQAVTDSEGTVVNYAVTVTNYNYVPLSDAGLGGSGNQVFDVLQSVESFAPFLVAASEPISLTFQPVSSTWVQQTAYYTTGFTLAQLQSVSTHISTGTAGGQTIQTTTYSNYTDTVDSNPDPDYSANWHENNVYIIKPQDIVTTVQAPGSSPITQSANYLVYNTDSYSTNAGEILAEVNALGQGELYIYSAPFDPDDPILPGGLLLQTWDITVPFSGNWPDFSNGVATLVSQTNYYTYDDTLTWLDVGVDDGDQIVPGASFGMPRQTVSGTGVSGTGSFLGELLSDAENGSVITNGFPDTLDHYVTTDYAYNAAGQQILDYTFKSWTAPNGDTIYGWVGTNTDYNADGQPTDVYQETYTNGDGSGTLDFYDYMPVTDIGVESVVDPEYNGLPPLLISHKDYNSLGQVIDSVDQYGGTTTYTYNTSGDLMQTVYPDGTETLTVFDNLDRPIWTTNRFNPTNGTSSIVATNTIYNGLGQALETATYVGTNIQITTTTLGTLIVHSASVVSTGTFVSATTNYYNAQGPLAETDSPGGERTGTVYYPDGQTEFTGPLKSSAANTGTSTWFDIFNGTASSVFVSNTTYTYDLYDSGRTLFFNQVTDPDGNATDTYMDAAGRTVLTVYADGSFTETDYSLGTATAHQTLGGTSLFTPSFGISDDLPNGDSEVVQIAQRTNSDPVDATYDIYDAAGNLITVYQPAVVDGNPADSTYGDSMMPEWLYTYDAAGNETEQEGPFGESDSSQKTYFHYDQYGNMIGEKLPDGQTNSFTFNSFNQEATSVDYNGNTSTFTYYTNYGSGAYAGSLEKVTYSPAPSSGKSPETVSYTYTNTGLQASVTDASGTTDYSYDDYGNQIEANTPEGTIYYDFNDATGRLSWADDYGETNIGYGYNTLGQLVTVTAQYLGGHYVDAVTTYGYDPAGNMISEIMPNGVTNTYSYDSQNRLTAVLEVSNTGTTLFSQTNTLNVDGTIQSAVEYQLQTSGTVVTNTYTYGYDALDRLTGETLSSSQSNLSYTNTFTYDLNSNQMSETHVTGATTQVTTNTYNANDELTSSTVTTGGTTNSYTTNTYDNNGSLTKSVTDAGGTWTTNGYSYDVRNKMSSYVYNGSTLAAYVYNDSGDRVAETAGGATTSWLTNTNNPTGYDQPMEEKIGGSLAESYVIGERILGQMNSGGTLSWLLVDGHGSTEQLSNSSGGVTGTLTYDSFGDVLASAGFVSTPWMFGGGGIYDPVSGMYFNGDGARTIEAGQSGFDQRDIPGPWETADDPLSLNPYVFGDGDPENMTDPTGHFGYSSYSANCGRWADQALAPIAAGVSALEGVEAGFANAATDVSSYVGGLAAGFAGGLTSSLLGFDGYVGGIANGVGDAITSIYDEVASRLTGFYGTVGVGVAEPGVAAAGVGIAFSIGQQGIFLGGIGFASVGLGLGNGLGASGTFGYNWGPNPGWTAKMGPTVGRNLYKIINLSIKYVPVNNTSYLGLTFIPPELGIFAGFGGVFSGNLVTGGNST